MGKQRRVELKSVGNFVANTVLVESANQFSLEELYRTQCSLTYFFRSHVDHQTWQNLKPNTQIAGSQTDVRNPQSYFFFYQFQGEKFWCSQMLQINRSRPYNFATFGLGDLWSNSSDILIRWTQYFSYKYNTINRRLTIRGFWVLNPHQWSFAKLCILNNWVIE